MARHHKLNEIKRKKPTAFKNIEMKSEKQSRYFLIYLNVNVGKDVADDDKQRITKHICRTCISKDFGALKFILLETFFIF